MPIRGWTAVLVCGALLAGQACAPRAPGLSASIIEVNQEARTVMTLRVRLGDGFQDNTVTLRVNGQQVFHKSGVTTDLRISRADSVDLPVGSSIVRLEVAVDGGPSAAREIDPAETPFVDASVVEGRLELQALPRETPML